MPDMTIEDGLRAAFRAESDAVGLTITTGELERRLAARRRQRTGRRLQVMAAAVAIVAVGAVAALSNGWLKPPAIGAGPTPGPSATNAAPSSGLQPIPATPGRIEVTRIDPTPPTGPFDRTFEGLVERDTLPLHATVSCLGDGAIDFYLDGQHQHVDCSSDGETSVSGVFNAADDVLGYRLVVTGRLSYSLLVEQQVGSEPPPNGASESPAAFTPPEMQVRVSTLGEPGATSLMRTACYSYELADGSTGTTRCPIDPSRVACCETLDVPWGSDLTFTIPDGWLIDRSEITSKDSVWTDADAAQSRSVVGWSSLGDDVIVIEGTYSKGGDRFTATFAVPIDGPDVAAAVVPSSVQCGAPDLSAPTPPTVHLFVDGAMSVAGELRTNSWRGSVSDSAVSLPPDPVEVSAGAALELRIADDVCAGTWLVEYGPPVTDVTRSVPPVGSLVLLKQNAPGERVTEVMNRFDLAELPPGDWVILAWFRYADGEAFMELARHRGLTGPSGRMPAPWGYSSAGRAPAWHAGGPGFESP